MNVLTTLLSDASYIIIVPVFNVIGILKVTCASNSMVHGVASELGRIDVISSPSNTW